MTEKTVSYIPKSDDYMPLSIEEFMRDARKFNKQKIKIKGMIPTVSLIADICERILIIEKRLK